MAILQESIGSSKGVISIVSGTGDDTTSDMHTISVLATKRSTESLQTRDYSRSDRSHIVEAGQSGGESQPGDQIQQKEEDEDREAQRIHLQNLQGFLDKGTDPDPWKIYKEWLQVIPTFHNQAVRVCPYVQGELPQTKQESLLRPGYSSPEVLLQWSHHLWYEARARETWLNVRAEKEDGTFLTTITMKTS